MNDSILEYVKPNLGGIPEDCTAFDSEIISYINSSIMIVSQLVPGVTKNFSVKSSADTWHDFFSNIDEYQAIKDFIVLRVKLRFDPPSSSFVLKAFQEELKELEWRIIEQRTLKDL